MNRSSYFDYIEDKLCTLAYRISTRGKLNLLNLNIHSETFFSDLLNILFDLELENANATKQNIEGIDLVDHKNKIIIQVSATCSKQKIEDSLNKEIMKEFVGFRFKFVSIAKDATSLKSTSFTNPYGTLFSPREDIVDIDTILNIVLNMPIDNQRSLYEFIKKELGAEMDMVKVDTNLATIINILAAENLNDNLDSPDINKFEINRKIEFNDLADTKDTIDDYKIYYQRLDEKYSEFDREGSNKSLSVYQIIKKQYQLLQNEPLSSPQIFYRIIDNIIDIIKESKNYNEIPYEELEMCVHIMIVDAFIRCKIFKNPEGYSHVVAR